MSAETVTIERSPVIRLDAAYNVAVARVEIAKGTYVASEDVTTLHDVPMGHKIATVALRKGDPVLKYNTIIGYAGEDVAPGAWMHTHNVLMDEVQKDYAFGRDYKPTEYLPPEHRATFLGIKRPDGSVATRNYIGVFITVNCSATVARKIANYFDE